MGLTVGAPSYVTSFSICSLVYWNKHMGPLACRYNTVMKVVFLVSSFTIIYLMRFHPSIKYTYDKQQDTFRVVFVVLPAAVLALAIHQDWTIIEVSCHSIGCMDGLPDRCKSMQCLTKTSSEWDILFCMHCS